MTKRRNGTYNRIEWVDLMKFVCIMCVMLSHCEFSTHHMFIIYHAFYLTGFYLLAGYVYVHKASFLPFLKRKLQTLLLPWLVFSVFNIMLTQVITFHEQDSLLTSLAWNFYQIREKGDELWFIAALFVAFLPFYYLVNLYEKSDKSWMSKLKFVFILLILAMGSEIYSIKMNPNFFPWKSAALPWHIEKICPIVFWMFLGYLFREKGEKVFEDKMNHKIAIFLAFLFLLVALLPDLLQVYVWDKIISVYYIYPYSLLGLMSVIYICKKIPASRYALYLGENTILCFAFHGKIISLVKAILARIIPDIYGKLLSSTLTSSIMAIILTIGMSLVLLIPIYIINRWFPFLIGRRRKV